MVEPLPGSSWRQSIYQIETLLNTLRSVKDLPFIGFATAFCILIAAIFFSKYLAKKAFYFIELKKSWEIKWKIKCLKLCERDLTNMIKNSNCNPIMLRLAWSDAGTYDKNISTWPICGGCNGSIRQENENQQSVNKGLEKAIALLLPIKLKYSSISWADLIQMAGANAIKLCGGPDIRLKYGRLDIPKDYFKTEKSNLMFSISQSKKLPCNFFPYPDGSHTPEFHIRNVFFRLGFSSREIVALCGAHTIGRGFRDRTGVCPFSSGDRGATQYTRLTSLVKGTDEAGVGMAGGMSWTENWLQFDNSYFKRPYTHAQLLKHDSKKRHSGIMSSAGSTTGRSVGSVSHRGGGGGGGNSNSSTGGSSSSSRPSSYSLNQSLGHSLGHSQGRGHINDEKVLGQGLGQGNNYVVPSNVRRGSVSSVGSSGTNNVLVRSLNPVLTRELELGKIDPYRGPGEMEKERERNRELEKERERNRELEKDRIRGTYRDRGEYKEKEEIFNKVDWRLNGVVSGTSLGSGPGSGVGYGPGSGTVRDTDTAHLETPMMTPREERERERTRSGDLSSVDSSFTSNHSGPDKHNEKRRHKSSTFGSSTSSLCPLMNSELLWLPTDDALFKCPEFKFYFEQYAHDQKLFFSDYSSVHKKMSELGAKFDPPCGIEF